MTNMSIQPLWLTHLLELYWFLNSNSQELIVGELSYKAHFRPQISSNERQAILHPAKPVAHTGSQTEESTQGALLLNGATNISQHSHLG